MHLEPMDILQTGTKVVVGNRRGEVVSHETVQAHPSGLIVVHAVKLTEKIKILTANRRKWISIEPVIMRVNYAGINY